MTIPPAVDSHVCGQPSTAAIDHVTTTYSLDCWHQQEPVLPHADARGSLVGYHGLSERIRQDHGFSDDHRNALYCARDMKLWLSSVTTQCITHHHDIECPNARNQVIKIYKSGPLSINSLPPILILRSRSLLEKSTATQHILIFFEQPRFFSSGPLLHLRTKPRSTSILWPPPFHPPDGNMSERPPMCIYIGRIFICGHTEIDLYLNCTNCVQRIQQIQYQPGAPYSYSWPGRCEPTTGVNILFMRPPPSQVCRRCHRDGFQWRGSTGLYS